MAKINRVGVRRGAGVQNESVHFFLLNQRGWRSFRQSGDQPPPLDTIGGKARDRARTWSIFGHRKQEIASQSQNLL
ncbi:hypothetical protein C1N70_03990 [Cytobacillus firmus]